MNYIDTIKMVNNESKFEVLINGIVLMKVI